MADIRINSLPTTASASSSDDFLALDGATNGTRKLNAYSPTFGGNLTVSGTATIGSSADVKLARGPSGSGNLAVTAATDGYCEITARGAAGNLRIFSAYTGGNFNWYWGADASAQTGSDAGSNFVLVAGSDTGSSLGSYLTVNRATAATTLLGNLTVSGTGTSSFAGPLLIAGAPSSSVANLSLPNALGATVNQAYFGDATRGMGMRSLQDGSNTAAAWFGFATPSFSTFNEVLRMTQNAAGTGGVVAITGNLQIGGAPNTAPSTIDRYSSVNVTNVADFPAFLLSVADGTKNVRGSMYIDASTTQEQWAWDFSYSSGSYPQYKWKIAGTTLATLRDNGNFILSSTGTDNANGKLQLADHTTSAGGIGFGTGLSLFTSSASVLDLSVASGNPTLRFLNGTTVRGGIGTSGTTLTVQSDGGSIILASNSTTALTLDASQNATFAGDRVINRKDQNAVTRLQVRNDTSGTSGQAQIAATVGDFTTYTALGQLSAGFTSTGLYQANSGYFVGSNALYIFTASASSLVLGTNNTTALTLDSSQNATFAGTVIANKATTAFRIPTAETPASASATGTVGTITWDASYIYVCTAANTWKRVAIATWP